MKRTLTNERNYADAIYKKRYLILFFCLVIISCGSKKRLSGGNIDGGWTKLFNGRDTKDWFVKINHHE